VSAFIDSQKAAGFAVELICRTVGVSRSAHYARVSGRRSPRVLRDEQLVATIRELHAANFEAYGYRKMHLALRRAGVEDVGRDRVKRLMREHGIQGAKRRGKPWRTTVPDPDAARRPDLVERDFTATGPDQLYVADFRICAAGKACCSSRSSSTSTAAASSAGSSPRTCAPRWSATRCGWPSAPAHDTAPTSSSYITATGLAIHGSGLRPGPRRLRRAAVGRLSRRRL
jgi:hypothetical protein